MIKLSIALILTGSIMLALTTYKTEAKSSDTPATIDTSITFIDETLKTTISNTDPSPIAPQIVVGESLYQKEEREKAEAERKAKAAQLAKARLAKPKTQIVTNSVVSVSPDSYNLCSCVLFAKAFSGKNPGPIGLAKNWPINSQEPQAGAVVITKESSGYVYTGHVGVVTAVDSEFIYIVDANFVHCQKTNRKLPRNSLLIRGYYN